MKRGRLNLNKTGYTKGTPTEDNDYNIIPSNRISMQNVDKNIIAIPVDSNGKIMDTKVMKPGDEELFENADFVIETPEKPKLVAGAAAAALGGAKAGAATGGLSSLKGLVGSDAGSFIMNNPNLLSKVSQDKKDKFPNNPALIGGMGMGNMMMYGGKLKKAQDGTSGEDVETDLDRFYRKVKGAWGGSNNASDFSTGFFNAYGQYMDSLDPMEDLESIGTDIFNAATGNSSTIELNEDPEWEGARLQHSPAMTDADGRDLIQSDLTTQKVDSPLTNRVYPFGQEPLPTGEMMPEMNYQANGIEGEGYTQKSGQEQVSDEESWESLQKRTNELDKDEDGKDLDLDEKDKKILNPYGGVDIPTAFSQLGASIESGDTGSAIASGAKALLGSARNFATGMGLQRRQDNMKRSADEKKKEIIKREYKEGGKASEMLTGDYSGEQEQANAEAEGGEYRKDEQGNVTQIKGDKHLEGGVEVSLKKQEEILTDHTKLKGNLAKEIRKNFDIDVKAKNTYSDVIDKYRSKSGLKKLSKEEEKVIKKLDKVVTKLKKDPEDNTQQLNKQFLQNKINEISKKKEPLKQKESQLFSLLFQSQEDNKDKSSENLSKNKLVQQLKESNNLTDDDANQAIKAKFGLSGEQIEQINEALKMYEGIPQEAIDQAMENDPSLTVDQAKGKVLESALQNTTTMEELEQPNENTNNKIDIGEEEDSNPDTEEEKDDMYIPNLPNQMPLPPRGVQDHLMTDFDAERMDAPYVDPANAISEARRSEMQMEEQLRGLPASQRAAVMASVTAQTQNQKNKILSDINRANMEAQMKTRQANAQASDKEEMMDQKSALSYEKRQMTANAKTEANIRGFYNHLNDLNTVNYNTIENMNLANQLSDDYFYNTQTGKVEQATNNKLTDTQKGRGRKTKKNKKD